MKKLILIAAMALVSSVSSVSFAETQSSSVSTVMNGTIDVGTFIGAAPGQYMNQTSEGSVTAFTTVLTTTPPEYSRRDRDHDHEQFIPTATVFSSIEGHASSDYSGTGWVLPSWTAPASSSIVNVRAHTDITNFPIPVTTLFGGNGGHDEH